jgi:single-strand DNA-binding protein
MELTGKVTADATVHTTKSGSKVVHFTIALNDRYKPKDSDTWKTLTTFVNCSYWMREGIAQHLTKGTIAEVQGRISVSAWINAQGEAKGSLNFHVNSVNSTVSLVHLRKKLFLMQQTLQNRLMIYHSEIVEE